MGLELTAYDLGDLLLSFNWLSIALATIASMVVAGVWYQDWAFGKAWKKLTKIDAKRAEKAGNTPMLVVLVVNFFTAIVLTLAIAVTMFYFDDASGFVRPALVASILVWLVSASTLLTHNMFEQKPLRLTAINSGYQLTSFVVMALIIGIWLVR